MADLSRGTWPAELFERDDSTVVSTENGIDTIAFDSVPCGGAETSVFAYLGVPDGAEPVPGMVLVHGGGGTAYREWVELWNERGYAAISMDLTGVGPDGERHERSGPPQDHDVIFDPETPWPDLWTHHAIAAVIRSHTILRGHARVDTDRIGVTGISWGGYLTCIVAGVDNRFGCAIPVYGCGYLAENSADVWMEVLAAMSPEQRARWNALCDPSSYLPNVRMPMLFLNGTNDLYALDSHTKCARLPRGPVSLCVRHEMPHSHTDGWAPREIARFADQHFRGATPLPQLGEIEIGGNVARANTSGGTPPYAGRLLYTGDPGKWMERQWHDVPADVVDGAVVADVPDDATVFYVAVEDADGMYASAFQIER